jgi:hypothetical protein
MVIGKIPFVDNFVTFILKNIPFVVKNVPFVYLTGIKPHTVYKRPIFE